MVFDPISLLNFHLKKYISLNVPDIKSDEKPGILLNSNENALGSPLINWYHRFPAKEHKAVNSSLAAIKKVSSQNFILGNGKYESIDLLLKLFCNPGIDQIIAISPDEMNYEDIAILCNVGVFNVPLLPDFHLDLIHIEQVENAHSKIIFIGSPNHISGNAMHREDILMVLNNFNGLVVIDETYVNFSRQKSYLAELQDYPNLIILQSFDIAWGLADLQVSMTFASEKIIQLMQRFKLSRGLSIPVANLLLKALEEVGMVNDMIKELVQMRAALKRVLEKFPFIVTVYPSDANFLLVKMNDAETVFDFLLQKGILVKNVSHKMNCENCLRITVGTEEENTQLIEALVEYYDLSKQ